MYFYLSLKVLLSNDVNQDNINQINLNYLKFFSPLYSRYKENSNFVEVDKLKSLSRLIAERSNSKKEIAMLMENFR